MEYQSEPLNPIEAVFHPDPYPYYASLVKNRPIYYDQTLRAWVVSSATMISKVLAMPQARVRPVTEPVPGPFLGAPLGQIFSQLIRMNDGKLHDELKPVVLKALGETNPHILIRLCQRHCQLLMNAPEALTKPGELIVFAFRLPVYVLLGLMGFEYDCLPQTYSWLTDFAQALANPSDQLEKANAGAENLVEAFNALISAERSGTDNNIVERLAREIEMSSYGKTVIAANALGLLFQTYEATAGLIGNSLVALANFPEVREKVLAKPELVTNLVQEVLRYDSPVQNTRRFLAEDTVLAGQALKAGEMILLVLAAANRDPLLNPAPERFDLFRHNSRTFSFSSGSHACPGQSLAIQIAQVAVTELLQASLVPQSERGGILYRPSANIRMPVL
ncbi:MAG TPA: cytochrome P450 [Chloroflexia bacterium]|nr:cytochrome P450 [Chloroflexia bacterium]